jgi:CPA2 family monovalent cation:H+ antiporter-2
MQIPLLQEVVIILGLSVLVILIFQRLKLPTILGFLLTGVLIGPFGFSLIKAIHEVEVLAEIGVILLLFVIGLEFSLKSLMAIKKTVFVGGSVQVFVTIGVTALSFYLTGQVLTSSIFMGFLFALSSTAIVLKLLQESGAMNTPHGKISLAILIYQDIIVVPMMLVTPLMVGDGGNLWEAILILVGKAFAVILAVILGSRYIVPRLLYAVARTKSKELFVLTVVVLCFSVAWMTSVAGLSLALGAFMAGLIISESEYSHQATANILPFREIFTSFFFVSIGMLLDVQFFVSHLGWVLLFAFMVMVAKALIASLAALVLRYPIRTVLLTGLALFQVGEFAFILSKTGLEYNLLSDELYQYFLAISLMTMAVTPFVFKYSDDILAVLVKTPLPKNFSRIMYHPKDVSDVEHAAYDFNDHLVIIGYGINGKNVAKAARFANIPYVILELNPDTVRDERAKGEPIYFGDATQEPILTHINIQLARVVVVAISDPEATKRIIVSIRSISQKPHIIIRTRFIQEMADNYSLGANEVIPEEFETSIEIFSRVLSKYLVPQDEVAQFIEQIREGSYRMFRPVANGNEEKGAALQIPDIEISTLKVTSNSNEVVGKSIADCQLRKKYHVTLLAIKRNEVYLTDIDIATQIETDDILFVFGRPEHIAAFNKLIEA